MSLYQEIQKLTEQAVSKKQHQNQAWIQANEQLLELFKKSAIESITKSASRGHTEARIYDFKFGDQVKINDIFAKSLLENGTVIEQLQQWFDTDHCDDQKERAFLVYFTLIGRFKTNLSDNKFGVFVNWNKQDWERIQERVKQRKNRSSSKSKPNSKPKIGRKRSKYGNRKNTEKYVPKHLKRAQASASVPVPASGTTVPASGTTVPASGTTVPASGTTVPASGTTVPASGTTVPTKTKIKPKLRESASD